MRHVLCFGDSNTWGYRPGSGDRYDEHTRWTGVLQDLLGDGWRVHEDGLNGRETVQDNPTRLGVNGLDALPYALLSQKPLDLVILSLGTNDLKRFSASYAADGVGRLIGLVQSIDTLRISSSPVFADRPRVLVISPIEVAEMSDLSSSDLTAAHAASLRFPELYAIICRKYGVDMIDAQQIASPSSIDGLHMMPEGHLSIARAVYQWIQDHFD